jgi:hypothetical protein
VSLAAIGEKFKFADFVDNGALANFPEQRAHVASDDQRARSGIELLGPFENFDGASRLRQK